jgi:hypothetical protein
MDPIIVKAINQVDKKNRIRENIDLIYKCYLSLSLEKLQELTSKNPSDMKIEVWNQCKSWITSEEINKLEDLLDLLISNKSITLDEVMNRFEKYNIPTYEDKLNHMVFFIQDKKLVVKKLLTVYSFLETKCLEQYLIQLVLNCDVTYSPFIPKYQCQCGGMTDVQSKYGDTREVYHCCNRCGRSTKTWKLVSGKVTTLTIRTKRRFFGFKVSTHDTGFVPSNYKMYDMKYEEYLDFFGISKPSVLKE